jgi:hypothetical protein
MIILRASSNNAVNALFLGIIALLVIEVDLNYKSLTVVQKFMEGPCGKL